MENKKLNSYDFSALRQQIDDMIKSNDADRRQLTGYYTSISGISASYTAADTISSRGLYQSMRVSLFDGLRDEYQTNGFYSEKKNVLALDAQKAKDDIRHSTLVALHEGTHLGQFHARENLKKLQTREDWLLGLTFQDEPRETLGICTSGTAYISTAFQCVDEQSHGSHMRDYYYRAQFVERQAVETTILFGEALGLDVENKKRMLSQTAEELRFCWGAMTLTDEEVFEHVDSAQYKLLRGLQPESSLEARIMVEMAALIYEQDAVRGVADKEIAKKLLSYDDMAIRLSYYGFEGSQIVPFYVAQEKPYEQIENLSQEARNQSPALMAFAIAQYGLENVEHLINFDSLHNWYFSTDNFLSKESCDLMVAAMDSTAYSRDVVDDVIFNNKNWRDIGKEELSMELDNISQSH